MRLLTGDPEELGRLAVSWGFDGIEYMPNPEYIPNPEHFITALKSTGALMPVINSGRIAVQGMSLLNQDEKIQQRAKKSFKRLLDFAGYCKARVGLGMARGTGIPGKTRKKTKNSLLSSSWSLSNMQKRSVPQ